MHGFRASPASQQKIVAWKLEEALGGTGADEEEAAWRKRNVELSNAKNGEPAGAYHKNIKKSIRLFI